MRTEIQYWHWSKKTTSTFLCKMSGNGLLHMFGPLPLLEDVPFNTCHSHVVSIWQHSTTLQSWTASVTVWKLSWTRSFSLTYFDVRKTACKIWHVVKYVPTLYGCELGLSPRGRKMGVKSVRITCWESEREEVTGNSRKLRNEEFIISTLHQILLGWSNKGEWDG
jgi:hypothetical protein